MLKVMLVVELAEAFHVCVGPCVSELYDPAT